MKPRRKELLLEQVDRLRAMRLPKGWEMAKLEVVFERKGQLDEWAQVIYWNYSGEPTFYVQTNKAIIYPEAVKPTMEAIEIMKRANEIINSNRKTESQ